MIDQMFGFAFVRRPQSPHLTLLPFPTVKKKGGERKEKKRSKKEKKGKRKEGERRKKFFLSNC